jgi:hypothetical protein
MKSNLFRPSERFRACLLATVVSLAVLPFADAFSKSSKWDWDGVARVVVLGDVHGALDKLTESLRAAGLVDDGLRWKGGRDHLVFCGDLVDRGPGERGALDLVRKLQDEARGAGGEVHVLVGNHEAMTLARDLRYVSPESYASFAPEEENSARRKAWDGFRKMSSKPGTDEAGLKAAFEKKYPPGYFARLKAFGSRGKYGSWLLEWPAAIRINGVAFVHGGLTPETAALGLDGANRQVSENLRAVVESIEVLDKALSYPGDYADCLGIARMLKGKSGSAEGGLPPELLAAGDSFSKQIQGLAFAPDGPLWYRGNSIENERAERDPYSRALQALGAKALVVGHTITRSGQITSRFNGRLYRADVGMAYGGKAAVLIFQQEGAKVLNPLTGGLTVAAAEPPPGEGRALAYEHIPDAQMEKFLADAEITAKAGLQRGEQRAEIFELKSGRLNMRGVFKEIDEGRPRNGQAARRYQHEIAAYWMDRRLGLGMVPPVIQRTVDGKKGSLRAVIETAIDVVSIRSYTGLEQVERDEALRRLAERYNLDLKELMGQAAKVRTFDTLIGNPGRQDEDRLWIPRDRKVALVDHERAFAGTVDVDQSLLCEYLDPDFRLAIQSLQTEELRDGLSSFLSEEQISAILARRDLILKRCSPAVASLLVRP